MSEHDDTAKGRPGSGSEAAPGSGPGAAAGTGAPITFEEFRLAIARELNVDERIVVPEASFVDDLYADSIRLVELMVRLQQQGITIPMEEAWDVKTVGDAYEVYRRHAGGSTGPRAVPG